MSVRIYQLSKQLNLENKELIAILNARGLSVDSPSNTIPNIYADALVEEYGKPEASGETKAKPAAKKPTEAKPEAATHKEVTAKAPEKTAAAHKSEAHRPEKKAHEEPAQHAKTHPAQAHGPKLPPPVVGPKMAPGLPQRPQTAPGFPSQSIPSVTSRAPTHTVPSNALIAPRAAPEQKPSFVPPVAPRVPAHQAAAKAPATPQPLSGINVSASLSRPQPIPNRPGPMPAVFEQSGSKTPFEQTGPAKVLACKPPIIVRDFAILLDMKPFRLISELMEIGVFASMNQVLEPEVAIKIAERHNVTLEVRHRGETPVHSPKPKEKVVIKTEEKLEPRPPVVCVLGHVDHGKTTLLDTIRKASVAAGEAGGITQHIGAYQVEHLNHTITFLDTPGHAAFSKMRERGANITDIAILVVAADDGFMPQTDEALKFAQRANVPVVVAVNKMDAKGANIDRVKQQMQQRNIASEDWGGETLCAPISAIKGEGITELLELVLLQAEMLELKAPRTGIARATVIESQIEQGLGPTSTVIVTQGTLKVGDALVCGSNYCKIRAMITDKGKNVKEATPSMAVRVTGWSGIPDAGTEAHVVKNEREAKQLAEDTLQVERKANFAQNTGPKAPTNIEELYAAMSDTKKTLKVLIKGDVHGSVEALKLCLEQIKSDKVGLEIIGADVGPITQNDVKLAAAANAVLVGFNTKQENGVASLAKHQNLRILQHNIIYELITQVEDEMAELLEPELKEVKLGAAEVRQIFALAKLTIAGCMVTEGKMMRDKLARLMRKGQVIYEGRITTMKRMKDEASEVRAGYECGIRLGDFDAYQEKDVIECFEIEKIKAKL